MMYQNVVSCNRYRVGSTQAFVRRSTRRSCTGLQISFHKDSEAENSLRLLGVLVELYSITMCFPPHKHMSGPENPPFGRK
jgi:hypothetical protein